jgi:hypothetical protein
VERRLEHKLARFRTDLEREPTRREQWRLEREAAVDSRPAKDHAHTPGELHHGWRIRLQALGVEPSELVAGVTGRQRHRIGIDPETAAAMVDRALVALTERQSTWRPAELVRELAAQVPTEVTVDPDQLTGFLQRLADDTVVTRCVDLRLRYRPVSSCDAMGDLSPKPPSTGRSPPSTSSTKRNGWWSGHRNVAVPTTRYFRCPPGEPASWTVTS